MNLAIKYFVMVAMLCVSTFVAHAQGSAQKPIILRVQHFLGPQSIQQTQMIGGWCRAIAKDSNDRLQCQIFPAMQLGGTPPQLFDQAKDGVADIVWTVAGYSPGRFTKTQVFELPFMMTDPAGTSRAAWDFVQKNAQDEFKGVKLLAVHVHGPGVIFSKNKPIKVMSDFKGLTLRAPTANATKMVGLMGATPVGMPAPQIPEALSKGVIQATLIPWEVAPSLKVNELTKFASETDPKFPALYTNVFVMPMNKAKYDALPPDLQAVIDKNSGRVLSSNFAALQSGEDVQGRKVFLETPVYQINTIPAAELEKWRFVTNTLDAEWVASVDKRGENGKALLQEAKELIKQNTPQSK
jgi:TRAP-type C4-dicarboxylate transport system substrate-binding protein